MKVYISSHSKELARTLSRCLRHCGVEVTSSWHAEPPFVEDIAAPTPTPEPVLSKPDAAERARREIRASDGLVMVAATVSVSCADGGRLFEAGYAAGLGKRVWVMGRRECEPVWHESIIASDHYGELADLIRGNPA